MTAAPFLWHRQLAAHETPEQIDRAVEGIRKRDNLPGLIAGHFTWAGEEELGAAGFGPPSKQGAEAPWGHAKLFGCSVATDTDNPPALGPAGPVHASMSDWIRSAPTNPECNFVANSASKADAAGFPWKHSTNHTHS